MMMMINDAHPLCQQEQTSVNDYNHFFFFYHNHYDHPECLFHGSTATATETIVAALFGSPLARFVRLVDDSTCGIDTDTDTDNNNNTLWRCHK